MPKAVNTNQYFEDSTKGCAGRLENRYCVLNRVPNAEIGPEGRFRNRF